MNINKDYDSWRGILSWTRREMKCSLASHVASHTGHIQIQTLAAPSLLSLILQYVAVTTVITDVKQRSHKVVVVTVPAFCMILNLTFFFFF